MKVAIFLGRLTITQVLGLLASSQALGIQKFGFTVFLDSLICFLLTAIGSPSHDQPTT
jgi:predicted exporter